MGNNIGYKERFAYHDTERFSGNKTKALARDGYRCVMCGMTDQEHRVLWKRGITIDHKDGNGRYSDEQNNEIDNLETLCLSCHGKKDIIRRKWRAVKPLSNINGKGEGR
jgi:5-methylcytosine-specific restriction endonuclease McrA